jgi:methylated-DNA-[protein]-cysteine S-methyltransferase
MTTFLAMAEMDSPIGPLTLAAHDGKLCHIAFGTVWEAEEEIRAWGEKYGLTDVRVAEAPVLKEAATQLEDYFAGRRRAFDVPTKWFGTDFQMKVWRALLTIPYGETRSYKDIARQIGKPTAVRAVGGANHCNPLPILVPCHRVIGASGALVGYGGGLDKKIALLRLEREHRNAVAVTE